MGNKYKGTYRGTSARLQTWDYGWAASYFITVNTKYRICYFGRISNGKMQLTEAGCIALQYWNEIPGHFPFVKLGAFVIMPDHIHGIISIQKKLSPTKDSGNKTIINKVNTALSPGQKRF